jgi:hypothetical protein
MIAKIMYELRFLQREASDPLAMTTLIMLAAILVIVLAVAGGSP